MISLYLRFAISSMVLGIVGFIVFLTLKACGSEKNLTWFGKGLIAIAIILLNVAVLCIPSQQQEDFTQKKRTKKYNLVVIAIFKNEGHVINEWITHHNKEGVDHFYLIDNGSTDNYEETIPKDPNLITIVKDTSKFSQVPLYNKIYLEKAKQESNWIMVIDLDEFVYARKEFKTITEYLDSVPKDITSIILRWKMFGSNGKVEQPDSVIGGFTKRLDYNKKLHDSFNYFKTVARSDSIKSLGLHQFNIKNDKSRHLPYFNREKELNTSPLHLNHYAIQSKKWYEEVKMKRGDAHSSLTNNVRDWKYFNKYDVNDIIDTELADKRLRN